MNIEFDILDNLQMPCRQYNLFKGTNDEVLLNSKLIQVISIFFLRMLTYVNYGISMILHKRRCPAMKT